MARPRRINLIGGVCHVTQQCHSKSFSLARDSIKQKYLQLAYDIAKKDPIEFISFSVEDSHPHWVLKLPDHLDYTISQFMHKLNTRFGKWFNKTYHRKGSFWASRCSTTWVEPGSPEFFQLTRYVDRNPIERQSNVINPEDYKWGSFHWLFNPEAPFPVTFLKYLYKSHPQKSETEAWQWYRKFVQQDDLNKNRKEDLFKHMFPGLFVGSERFKQKAKEIYTASWKNLQVRGLSWIKVVRDYSTLFLPMAQLTAS
ncbi:MAG: transposase [Acidobacteria bacterium]|nr:transposase [Acidobacteriota bacterium]MBI3658320.1 transposase [Acidobacteriota bacterium]